MTVRLPSPDSVGARKLKAHKKSRKGCANCKLRSVKCDESQPSCKRCVAYGVSCSYTSISNDNSLLQLPSELTTIISLMPSLPYFPDPQSELIAKFQNRTALTVTANGRLPLYQNEIVSLAYSNTYLMNSILALTLLHDHQLSGAHNSPTNPFRSSHYTKAIHSFNTALSRTRSQPPHHLSSPDAAAALWTTGAMLGTICFCNIDATTPSTAWPLRPSSPSDLDWLKMNQGKKSVYQLLTKDLMESNPVYAPLFEIHTNTLLPPSTSPPSFDRLPSLLLDYFNIFSTPSDSDVLYHPSIRLLARVYSTHCSLITTILTFWTWCAEMTPLFRSRLEQKEPRALLILAFWWAEVYQTTVWWFTRRSRLEGLAICMYIEKHFWEDESLVQLAQYPRAVFETPLFG